MYLPEGFSKNKRRGTAIKCRNAVQGHSRSSVLIMSVHIVRQWSGSGGTEAYLSGQLASFSDLTLSAGSSDM